MLQVPPNDQITLPAISKSKNKELLTVPPSCEGCHLEVSDLSSECTALKEYVAINTTLLTTANKDYDIFQSHYECR